MLWQLFKQIKKILNAGLLLKQLLGPNYLKLVAKSSVRFGTAQISLDQRRLTDLAVLEYIAKRLLRQAFSLAYWKKISSCYLRGCTSEFAHLFIDAGFTLMIYFMGDTGFAQ
ncbi:hypothetical protein [Synechococcus sp. UW179A]|uniref:hypothetical protein n=1 Tax=Synechococcus sp. UW179A TaxID=2575510 RepID=UPI000E0E50F7|nr:hypothetical protein [Synechococcus sp. UW179A]